MTSKRTQSKAAAIRTAIIMRKKRNSLNCSRRENLEDNSWGGTESKEKRNRGKRFESKMKTRRHIFQINSLQRDDQKKKKKQKKKVHSEWRKADPRDAADVEI